MKKEKVKPENKVMGRPPKYTAEFAEELAVRLEQYTEENKCPIFDEFCYINKIDKRESKKLCELSERFLEIFRLYKAKQASQLIKVGITGKGNSGFIKFLLINNHFRDDNEKYQDKIEQEMTGAGGLPLLPPAIYFDATKPKEDNVAQ